MEIKVKQKSAEWFDARKKVSLTASKFGEALGFGKGRPYDFLASLFYDDDEIYTKEDDLSEIKQNGIELGKVLREAYELLTGFKTNDTGFWIPHESNMLYGYVGTSPDALVCQGSGLSWSIGLAEFKAFAYKLYSGDDLIKGIPRGYMAQVQGQMAICRMKWCDCMAVCMKTKEIMLKRVHFSSQYWTHVSMELINFCQILREAELRKQCDKDPFDFEAASNLQMQSPSAEMISAEESIEVTDILQTGPDNKFLGPSRVWMPFELLMGVAYDLPPSLKVYGERIIDRIDKAKRWK